MPTVPLVGGNDTSVLSSASPCGAENYRTFSAHYPSVSLWPPGGLREAGLRIMASQIYLFLGHLPRRVTDGSLQGKAA